VPQAQRGSCGTWSTSNGFSDRAALAFGQCRAQRACTGLRDEGGHAPGLVWARGSVPGDGLQRVRHGSGQLRVVGGDVKWGGDGGVLPGVQRAEPAVQRVPRLVVLAGGEQELVAAEVIGQHRFHLLADHAPIGTC
jgi:hypothetical protein